MLPSFQADALCPRRVFRLGCPRNVVPVAVSTRSRGIVVLSAPGVSHADERPGAAVLRLASAGRCCFDTGPSVQLPTPPSGAQEPKTGAQEPKRTGRRVRPVRKRWSRKPCSGIHCSHKHLSHGEASHWASPTSERGLATSERGAPPTTRAAWRFADCGAEPDAEYPPLHIIERVFAMVTSTPPGRPRDWRHPPL